MSNTIISKTNDNFKMTVMSNYKVPTDKRMKTFGCTINYLKWYLYIEIL